MASKRQISCSPTSLVPMKPTFRLLTWRHGNHASISSSQAVTWLGHWDCGPDASRLAPVSPAANLLQSRDTGKSEGPASADPHWSGRKSGKSGNDPHGKALFGVYSNAFPFGVI